MKGQEVVLVIDGEHYPAVVARAVSELRSRGIEPVVALMVGGGEKLGQSALEIGVPIEMAMDDPEARLAAAIERHGVSLVMDVSDEPVLDYLTRSRLASVALYKGASYEGAGFSFTPQAMPEIAVPSIAVIGTGKRTGKTAVGGSIARLLGEKGRRPVVVAMGRGGPAEPEVIKDPASLDAAALLKLVERGQHAASDYIEDALMGRVPTVGAWRAGGGLAGNVAHTNYPAAIEKALELDPGILVLEGSGSALPPARWDAGVLIVNAGLDPAYLRGYFGLYRILLSDLVVLTMVEDSTDPAQIASIEDCIRSTSLKSPRIVRTIFRPHPLEEVRGKKAWFATTAPTKAGEVLKSHLEDEHGARIVGMSHSLADRKRLKQELAASEEADVILVEVKAAAIDVVARFGEENQKPVVFVDNRPVCVGADPDAFESSVTEIAELALSRGQR